MFAESAETFSKYLLHTFSVITKSDCPIKHCDHCDSEVYGFLYSEKEKPVFTTKDLTIEHFNTMMAKQIEEEPERKLLGKTADQFGDETEFLEMTRSITSSKSCSVRFSEDCSVASPDNQFMSTASSRSGTSLESRLDNSQERPKTGCITSAKGRSNHSGPQNIPRTDNKQPGSRMSTQLQNRSSSSKAASRNSWQDSKITRSKSVGYVRRSNTSQSYQPSQERAASALPNIGRGREKVNLPPRPKTSSSMYRTPSSR